ncbi:MAG TPA: DegT/DnrJ/EryC1/StrS family aminotransferase, partial [Kofleriaceae bacterium]
ALGRTQTAKLPAFLAARRANYEALRGHVAAIKNVRVLDSQSADAANSHYCLIAVLEGKLGAERNAIIGELNAAGVGTSIYYPQPVPRMKYYRDKYGYDANAFPVATQISDCSIALPVGPHLHVEQMARIAEVFAACAAKRL